MLCTTLWISLGESLTSHRSSRYFAGCDAGCDPGRDGGGAGYFHCVETPNPAAMKPKPTTMFTLPIDLIGSEPSVT